MYVGEAFISYPRSHLSGYAEALSLATAANNAVAEAFNRRGGCDGEVHESCMQKTLETGMIERDFGM